MRARQTEMECFTYTGVETVAEVKAPERKKNEDIDQTQVSPAEAFARFAGKSVDVGGSPCLVTQSPLAPSPLERHRQIKAALSQFRAELSALPKDSPEMAAAFLQEITALEKDLESIVKDPSLAPFFAEPQSVGSVSQQMAQLKIESKKPDAKPPPPPGAPAAQGVTYELYMQQAAPTPDLPSIEKRLQALEQTIGIGQDYAFPDLQSGIVHLRRKLAVLQNPRELEAVMRKVTALMAELKALEAQKQQVVEAKATPHEAAINTLYKAMPEWDAAGRRLPGLVTRLQSLKEVCEQGASAQTTLGAIQKEQGQVDAALGQNQTAYTNLVAQLAAGMKQIESSVVDLEKKFGEAEKRSKAS